MVAQIRMSIVGIIHDRYVLVLQKKLKAMEKKGASKTKPTDSTKVRSDNRERLVRCYVFIKSLRTPSTLTALN